MGFWRQSWMRGDRNPLLGPQQGASGAGVRSGVEGRNPASFQDACEKPKRAYRVAGGKCELGDRTWLEIHILERSASRRHGMS